MHSFSFRSRPALAVLILFAATGLAGCDKIDPLNRPYAWHPDNDIANNVALMAANPADLVRGRTVRSRGARMESEAIDRVWSNKPTPLLTGGSGGSGSSSGGSGGSSSGGGS